MAKSQTVRLFRSWGKKKRTGFPGSSMGGGGENFLSGSKAERGGEKDIKKGGETKNKFRTILMGREVSSL